MLELTLVREIPEELRQLSRAEILRTLGLIQVTVGKVAVLGVDPRVCKIAIGENDPQGDDIGAIHALFYRKPDDGVYVTTYGTAPAFYIDGVQLRDARISRKMKRIRFGDITFQMMFSDARKN